MPGVMSPLADAQVKVTVTAENEVYFRSFPAFWVPTRAGARS